MVNLEQYLVNDQINLIQIYICPTIQNTNNTNDDLLKIKIAWTLPPKFITPIIKKQPVEYHIYHYQDMAYIYDISNDSQKVIKNVLYNDDFIKNTNNTLYIQSIKEDTLPCHRFPCISQIATKTVIKRWTQKINNRITINIDQEQDKQNESGYSIYITYNHNTNVDLKTMQTDLDKFIINS